MLKILYNGHLLEFDDEELNSMFVGDGNEAYVYKYGTEVLKIYKEFSRKDRLSENDVLKLSKIDTKRIFMPKKIIRNYDNLEFIGYSLPYISRHSYYGIGRIKIESLLKELYIIKDDIFKLTEKSVVLEDLHIGNLLYNGKFFIGDPGSYTFEENTPKSRIYNWNCCCMNKFVINDIFGMVNLTLARRKKLYSDLMSILDSSDMIDFLTFESLPNESINQFVKRIAR